MLRYRWTGEQKTPVNVMTSLTTIQEWLVKIKEISTKKQEVKRKECEQHFDEKVERVQEGELLWLRTPTLGPYMDKESEDHIK